MNSAEHNKQLVGRLVEIVNAGELAAIQEVASGEIAAQAAGWIGPFRRSFPGFRMEIVHLIAEADAVAAHFKCSGTHEGKWRGIPASHRRFEGVDEIYLFAVEDGKLSSALAVVEDDLARMRQLGIDPSVL